MGDTTLSRKEQNTQVEALEAVIIVDSAGERENSDTTEEAMY